MRSTVLFVGVPALFVLAVLAISVQINPGLTTMQIVNLAVITIICSYVAASLGITIAERNALPAIMGMMVVMAWTAALSHDARSRSRDGLKDPCESWADRFWTQTPQACTPDKVPVDPVTEASAYLACARLSDSADRRRALRAAAAHRLDGQTPLPVYEVSLKDCGHWRSLAYDVVDEVERARRQEEVTRVRRVRLGGDGS